MTLQHNHTLLQHLIIMLMARLQQYLWLLAQVFRVGPSHELFLYQILHKMHKYKNNGIILLTNKLSYLFASNTLGINLSWQYWLTWSLPCSNRLTVVITYYNTNQLNAPHYNFIFSELGFEIQRVFPVKLCSYSQVIYYIFYIVWCNNSYSFFRHPTCRRVTRHTSTY